MPGATLAVGSGTNDATALNISPVTRNSFAYDTPILPPLIGRPSGDRSPVLPAGQVYGGGVAVTSPAPASSETQSQQSAPTSSRNSVYPSPNSQGADRPLSPSNPSRNPTTPLADAVP
jgi:hypothetical protein